MYTTGDTFETFLHLIYLCREHTILFIKLRVRLHPGQPLARMERGHGVCI